MSCTETDFSHQIGEDIMNIRRTKPEELEKVMELYASARDFMRRQGNPSQWGSTEPKKERVALDIAEGHSFVCCEGEALLGVFSFESDADDPTYHEIREGEWPETDSYGVLHRIAVGTPGRGVAGFCLDWCWARCRQLRADTHADNLPMQRAMIKNGFERCGIIKTYDGTDRIAFARPASLWIAQSEKKRRQLFAASMGLYGLAVLLAILLAFLVGIDPSAETMELFLDVILYAGLGIVNLVLGSRITRYMDEIFCDVRPAFDRCTAVSTIVLAALFNEIAMIFVIINFATARSKRGLFGRIVHNQLHHQGGEMR